MSDDVRNTLEEREGRYGSYADVASTSQELKKIIAHDLPLPLSAVAAESLDMICNKISRIVNGDPMYVDSWHDIAGYAQLVVDWIEAQNTERIKADMTAHMQAHVDALSGVCSAMKGGTPEDFEREVLRPKARAEQREAVEIPDDVRVAPLQGTPEGYEQLKYAPEYEDLDRESHWLSRVRLRPGGAWGAWCRAETRQRSRADALAAASSAPDPDPDPVGDALAKARDEILGVGPEDAP